MQIMALATDYDGTLAKDSHAEPEAVAALLRLRESGRKVILVTGRELPELQSVFRRLDVCDVVVAENGGLLYWPQEKREEILSPPPPPELVAELTKRGVTPFSVGKVLVATWRPHEVLVLEAIQQLGIGYQIVFNKRAVMMLPSGVHKGTGLGAALDRLGIPADRIAGIGDAENDHAFLEICAIAAAVENALEAVKERCDLVTVANHGHGVIELVDRILDDDLASLGPRTPRVRLTVRTTPS